MPTTLRIKVTKEILEKSKDCGDYGESCAIARAVSDVLPHAYVESDQILPFWCFLGLGDDRFPIKLPHTANQFIKEFDASSPEGRVVMDEISFDIEIPDGVIENINIDEIRPLLLNHPTLELVEDTKG